MDLVDIQREIRKKNKNCKLGLYFRPVTYWVNFGAILKQNCLFLFTHHTAVIGNSIS